MDFKKIVRSDNEETGAITLSVTISKEALEGELEEFYATIAEQWGKDQHASWDDLDDMAMGSMSSERYGELRRDFVIGRIATAALSALHVEPALTPSVRAPEYPSLGCDYSLELLVVERPHLTLTSCDSVEIETEDIGVTDDMVDARIAGMLESRATYEKAADHVVVPGDCISVDIATLSDGKVVPHLTGKKMVLELADGSMPDGFVRQLVGTQVGETRSIEYAVKRPRAIVDSDVDAYVATVTVLAQLKKVIPAFDDEWVSANTEKASTVDEFRAGVAQGLAIEVARANRDTHARLANIELEKRLQGKIPDAFYQASRKGLMDKLERELAEKGQTFDDYYEQNRMNEEELSVQMLIKSGENLRQGFALEALFEGRGMRVSDNDLQLACEHAFGEGSYDLDELQRSGRYRLVESAAKRMVALNWLADTAIVRG